MRIWKKIDQSGGPDACWPWTGVKNNSGYGMIKIAGKLHRAHRVVFELEVAAIPDGKVLRHTCDNRICCNPAHLLVGTQADNIRDMMERGRHRPSYVSRNAGVLNAAAKLTDQEVEDLCNMYVPRIVTQAWLAGYFGISQSAVSLLLAGKRRAA